jgi:hypothetical protein
MNNSTVRPVRWRIQPIAIIASGNAVQVFYQDGSTSGRLPWMIPSVIAGGRAGGMRQRTVCADLARNPVASRPRPGLTDL